MGIMDKSILRAADQSWEATPEEKAAAQAFRRANPMITLGNSGWDGCRVVFRRIDGDRTARVYLDILPENYCGGQRNFSLTAQERRMAREELAMYGVSAEKYVISSAEMFSWELDMNKEEVGIIYGEDGGKLEDNWADVVDGPLPREALELQDEPGLSANTVDWLISHAALRADEQGASFRYGGEVERSL